eukprot:TRINITY_DN81929_c0_g1_i1.p1 TRINITY_DN81929_c0_g1~~TRINITY_DN81929_c0_g1_i1.p1  ORF type:complete len:190 (-),score=31.74 TRINITY_DN81929_c0_g1_i1:32-601(-)
MPGSLPAAGPLESLVTNQVPTVLDPLLAVKDQNPSGLVDLKAEWPMHLLRKQGVHPERISRAWRCIPMHEATESQVEAAMKTGPDPTAGLCTPRHKCPEISKKLLKDPAGVPYWVVAAEGGQPDKDMDTGPLHQPRAVTMACEEGRLERRPDLWKKGPAPPKPVEIYAPALAAMPKLLRANEFLGSRAA